MNPTSIRTGTVPGNGVQAQLVLRSLKLLSWSPTLTKPGLFVGVAFWDFFLPKKNRELIQLFLLKIKIIFEQFMQNKFIW